MFPCVTFCVGTEVRMTEIVFIKYISENVGFFGKLVHCSVDWSFRSFGRGKKTHQTWISCSFALQIHGRMVLGSGQVVVACVILHISTRRLATKALFHEAINKLHMTASFYHMR